MPALSLREAVKMFNVSRPTLTKALKEGRISGVRDSAGNWQIESSELSRLYQGRGGVVVKPAKPMPAKLTTLAPSKNDARGEDAAVRIAQLEAQLDAERTARELVERHLADLRALLPSPARQARRWWPW
jgi:hypothetical protein